MPAARLVPSTARTAVPVLTNSPVLTTTVPKTVFPSVKVTLPEGVSEAVTVAVRTVVECGAISGGFAITTVSVTFAGGRTVNITGADAEPAKVVFPL